MRTTSITDALLPKLRQRLLAATLLQPERSWYAAELARHLRTRPSSLQRELAALSSAGILKRARRGRMVYFQPDTDCPVFSELHGLLTKTAGLVDVLHHALGSASGKIRAAFVYGSVARAGETTHSDVDLIVVGTLRLSEASTLVRPARGQLGREINVRTYSPEEFASRVRNRDHFLSRVMTRPKLFVIGTENELGEITGR